MFCRSDRAVKHIPNSNQVLSFGKRVSLCFLMSRIPELLLLPPVQLSDYCLMPKPKASQVQGPRPSIPWTLNPQADAMLVHVERYTVRQCFSVSQLCSIVNDMQGS